MLEPTLLSDKDKQFAGKKEASPFKTDKGLKNLKHVLLTLFFILVDSIHRLIIIVQLDKPVCCCFPFNL